MRFATWRDAKAFMVMGGSMFAWGLVMAFRLGYESSKLRDTFNDWWMRYPAQMNEFRNRLLHEEHNAPVPAAEYDPEPQS